jgi:hypothetical protein
MKAKFIIFVSLIISIILVNSLIYAREENGLNQTNRDKLLPKIEWQKVIQLNDLEDDLSNEGKYILDSIELYDKGIYELHLRNKFEDIEDYSVLQMDINGNIVANVLENVKNKKINAAVHSVKKTIEGDHLILYSSLTDIPTNYSLEKFDQYNKSEWAKTYSNNGELLLINDIIQTHDMGYILCGTKNIDKHKLDYYITKINKNGQLEWEKTFGGEKDDVAKVIYQTKDLSYIVGGITKSLKNGGGKEHLEQDNVWVIKLNPDGKQEWQITIDGMKNESLNDIELTPEGGYVVLMTAESLKGDVRGKKGQLDCWVIKISKTGNIEWEKCFGGSKDDYGVKIINHNNENFVLLATTYSNNGDIKGNHGDSDYWIALIDSKGLLLDQKCLGGTKEEIAQSILVENNKYIIGGTTKSNDGDISGNKAQYGLWVLNMSR